MNRELTKMEGLGNTFVILQGPFLPTKQEVMDMCREYGKKPADGLLVASSVDDETVRMKYWNSMACGQRKNLWDASIWVFFAQLF